MGQWIIQQIKDFPGATLKHMEELFQEELEQMLDGAGLLKVEAKRRFITQMDQIKAVYILVAGKVNALEEYRTGNVYIFQENTVPSIFGEMELIADVKVFMASLIAKTDCLLVVVPAKHYMDFIKRHPDILYQRAQLNLKMLLASGGDNRLYLQLQSAERIMLYFIKKYKRNKREEHCILSMTRKEIGDETGYSLKTVFRTLKDLEAKGFLSLSGHKILISESQYHNMVANIEPITWDLQEKQT